MYTCIYPLRLCVSVNYTEYCTCIFMDVHAQHTYTVRPYILSSTYMCIAASTVVPTPPAVVCCTVCPCLPFQRQYCHPLSLPLYTSLHRVLHVNIHGGAQIIKPEYTLTCVFCRKVINVHLVH